MLFWIFIICIFIGFLLIRAEFDLSGISLAVFGIFGGVISFFVLLCIFPGLNGTVAKYEQRYDTLVYQYENDIYDNDNDLGKRELITDIQKWNEDLAWNKEAQKDFWIGIYIPNIYDQFEFISLVKK